ncbi:uncharacterized protein LOC144325759 isoform X1 [Podarcis muralis]
MSPTRLANGAGASVTSQTRARLAPGTPPPFVFTMHSLLWVLWLCQGSSAVRRAAVEEQKEAVSPGAWDSLAFGSVVVLVLVLGAKWLHTKPKAEDAGEEAQLAHEQDLERHLLHAFFQMEMELVKLVTLVRNHKAALTLRHRGCRAPECQLARESAKAFNLVVFDIEEED